MFAFSPAGCCCGCDFVSWDSANYQTDNPWQKFNQTGSWTYSSAGLATSAAGSSLAPKSGAAKRTFGVSLGAVHLPSGSVVQLVLAPGASQTTIEYKSGADGYFKVSGGDTLMAGQLGIPLPADTDLFACIGTRQDGSHFIAATSAAGTIEVEDVTPSGQSFTVKVVAATGQAKIATIEGIDDKPNPLDTGQDCLTCSESCGCRDCSITVQLSGIVDCIYGDCDNMKIAPINGEYVVPMTGSGPCAGVVSAASGDGSSSTSVVITLSWTYDGTQSIVTARVDAGAQSTTCGPDHVGTGAISESLTFSRTFEGRPTCENIVGPLTLLNAPEPGCPPWGADVSGASFSIVGTSAECPPPPEGS